MAQFVAYGRLTARVDWHGPRVSGQMSLNYIHQMNRVNSRDGFAMMTAMS